MEARQFFIRLLDLDSSWEINAVELEERAERVEAERVDVYLDLVESAKLPCPECGRPLPAADRLPLQSWRHLDTCGKSTWLHARLAAVECPEHGKRYLDPPWGDRNSRVTSAFQQQLVHLAGAFGDLKKTALFAGVSPADIRHALHLKSKEGEEIKMSGHPVDGAETSAEPPADLRPKQLSLFQQNDMSFVNQAIQAFRNLNLEKAVSLFQKQRSLQPRGYDVSSWLAAAELLLEGIRGAPAEPSYRSAYLCRLWDTFEDHLTAYGLSHDIYAAGAKAAYFENILTEAQEGGIAESAVLPGGIPFGYILLRSGRCDEAIRALQSSIPKAANNAVIYGCLGDAYMRRGDTRVARQCYREACFIDPAGIDWRHLMDEDLRQLKEDLLLIYGMDPQLAVEWLPSHARMDGLFECKIVRIHNGLKELVDDYLDLSKAASEKKSTALAAKLFFRGIIFCENQEHLRFIKTIDLIQVRKTMKQANPELFDEFLENIRGGKG